MGDHPRGFLVVAKVRIEAEGVIEMAVRIDRGVDRCIRPFAKLGSDRIGFTLESGINEYEALARLKGRDATKPGTVIRSFGNSTHLTVTAEHLDIVWTAVGGWHTGSVGVCD
jgi:pentose-5-phosphate-3-epimerase